MSHPSDRFIYVQATGFLFHGPVFVAACYAGHGVGVNNPFMESVRNVGPAARLNIIAAMEDQRGATLAVIAECCCAVCLSIPSQLRKEVMDTMKSAVSLSPVAVSEETVINPLTPGVSTSEHALSRLAAIGGLAIAGLGSVADAVRVLLGQLGANGVSASWMSSVAAVCGTVLALATVLGYQRQRTALKIAAVNASNEP